MSARLSHSFLKIKTFKLMFMSALLVALAAFSFSTVESSTPRQTAPTLTPFGGGRGQIAFTSDRDGNAEIYVMNTNGTNVHRLTNNSLADYSPAWSRDGSEIAFVSRNQNGNTEISIMNADGSNVRRLTNTAVIEHGGYPTWSPDGTKITFEGLGTDDHWEIYAIDVDDTNLRNLTNSSWDEVFPAWSPDGMQIAFSADRQNYRGIFLMNADGSDVHHITNNYPSQFPAWSPDGTQIAYEAGDDHAPFTYIYVINTDGSNKRRLTDDIGGLLNYPVWSPDGTQIAFTAGNYPQSDIYVMNNDGSNVRNLTRDSTSYNSSPSWRP